jgi:hypothetical protein
MGVRGERSEGEDGGGRVGVGRILASGPKGNGDEKRNMKKGTWESSLADLQTTDSNRQNQAFEFFQEATEGTGLIGRTKSRTPLWDC